MAFDTSAFRTLNPSQFITFAIPNTVNSGYLRAPLLRIAVLDSPKAKAADKSPRIATLVVPEKQERDWLFCTESGHYQLIFLYNVSRLILVGNYLNPNTEPWIYIRPPAFNRVDLDRIAGELKRIAIDCHPIACFRNGMVHPKFASYEDDVLFRFTIERYAGPCVGEFVVEDVVLETRPCRRGLRFKSMPCQIQTHIPFIPRYGAGVSNLRFLESVRRLEELGLMMDTSVLAEPYLNCMVSGMFLISSPLSERMKQGFRPRALCLGVGGGSLLTFLNTQLGFQIVGVEIDEVVLSAARKYFGLYDGPSVKLIVGDAIELIEKAARDPNVKIDGLNTKFDVVMVDLVSNEAKIRHTAPPPGFARRAVLQAMRSLIHDHGVLILHVVPPDMMYYVTMIPKLKGVFHKVFELRAKTGHSYVLIATLTPIPSSNYQPNAFSQRLYSVIVGYFMDSLLEL